MTFAPVSLEKKTPNSSNCHARAYKISSDRGVDGDMLRRCSQKRHSTMIVVITVASFSMNLLRALTSTPYFLAFQQGPLRECSAKRHRLPSSPNHPVTLRPLAISSKNSVSRRRRKALNPQRSGRNPSLDRELPGSRWVGRLLTLCTALFGRRHNANRRCRSHVSS